MKMEDRKKIRQDLHSYLDQTMDKLEDRYEKINVRVGEAKEKTSQYVQENPQKSALIAAGIGAVTAFLMMGIIKKKRSYNRWGANEGM